MKLSNKVLIIGFDPDARFIAQALAAVPNIPPVQMFTHHAEPLKRWGEEGRAVTIYDLEKNFISSRNIPCPEHMSRRHHQIWTRPTIFDNIIISTASNAALPTITRLRQRIDRRTTLCLVQPGLGLMELLNENVFNDPATRPNYVICHSGHKFERHSSFKYSLRHLPGKLLLHAVPRDGDSDLDPELAKALGNQHTQHMIHLLSSADDLNAVSLPWHVLLRHKLPEMIFASLADAISVILGCRFDQIRSTRYAMDFWNSLLDETMRIVVSLPELRENPDMLDFFARESFPKKLKRKLERQGSEYSRWISMVRRGQMPPVAFFNGYFIRRARELGLDHTQNTDVLNLVKARQAARYRELQLDVPLGFQPYMTDSDRIGGGQYELDPLLDVEMDI
ncbi:hypothetical protein F4776DRAFT_641293 [Hypoxylon sp. NC0597]|nr:hypothetical protein F4776DRAFT_641293 [Hypoxylon sp. NC0597]